MGIPLHSFHKSQSPPPDNTLLLIGRQCRAALAWRRAELGLHKHLLHAILFLLELVVNLVQVFDAHSVGHHLQRVNFARLNLLEKFVPVQMDWCLSVTDEANTTLHKRADVEVVGLMLLAENGIARYIWIDLHNRRKHQ